MLALLVARCKGQKNRMVDNRVQFYLTETRGTLQNRLRKI